ncbi:MAG: serine/threonine protein kinase [Anaerolineae bacterium]|nr:serine/threonine protein kinase [Anaerolineae bacterium]
MSKQTRSGTRVDPLIGRLVGDYRLDALMATGGMARIYRGEDTRLGRTAAIKVLAHDDANDDDTLTKRFQREARELAKLEHPNIITIYQYGELEGLYFLAMKLIKGRDLAQEFKRLKGDGQAMEVKRVVRILMQVAFALDYAHANGVIHRDVKPSNILITDDDTAILTDFGLVMQSSTQTTLGTAFGTPRYIAPEQATASHKAMAQSDIYSLGVVLYELLTGEPPFTGDSPMEIALSHISDPPPPPRSKNPKIPVAVEQEILKALEKDPENRHRTAVEFITAVQHGYGIDTLDLPTITTISTRPQNLPIKPVVGKAAAKPKPASTTGQKSGWRKYVIAAVLAIIIVAAAGFILSSNPPAPVDGVPVVLYYSDSSFTFYNASDNNLNVQKGDFVRGVAGTNDDYSGDRVPGDTIESKKCFRIILQGDQTKAPPECGTTTPKREQLSNALRLFWRQESEDGNVTKSFEVRYNGNVIARCNTIARGGNDECRINWPKPK